MNSDFHKDNSSDYKLACELTEKDFSHSEMIDMLKNGNIPQKQLAALMLDDIETEEEGKILISSLTGCDGKIREAVSLKINRILEENHERAIFLNHPEIFANASIDINANICRTVIDSVSVMKNLPDFKIKYLNKILNFIDETYSEIDKFIFRDKKYVINKQLFKLYWCLESLKLFTKDIEPKVLLKILERASSEKEYTIREKTAQVLSLIEDEMFDGLKQILKNDENYYVKKALNS